MQNVLLVDNYDSFTYNLVQILKETGMCKVTVKLNDKVSIEEASGYDRIVLSPGPGLPHEAGNIMPIIQHLGSWIPILGICLGHQAIAEIYGAKLYALDKIIHGEAYEVQYNHNDYELFKDVDNPFMAGRYHSWSVSPSHFPEDLLVTAIDSENHIMALKHRKYPVRGVQFHPESIMTSQGYLMIQNWMRI